MTTSVDENNNTGSGGLARIWHLDDLLHAAAIEFPANVQNPEKALNMVGGEEKLGRTLQDSKKTPLELRLRPEDPFEHPVEARSTKNANLLLKVTVPKKCFDEANGDIHKAVALSEGRYRVRPSHILNHNFRFREMTDFMFNMSNSPFVAKFETAWRSGNWDAVKDLQLEGPTPITDEQMDAIPPPRFSSALYPHLYQYRQNPAISVVDDGKGGLKLINTMEAPKIKSFNIVWEDPIPKETKMDLKKVSENVQKAVEELKQAFEKRPFHTKKALEAHISPDAFRQVRQAMPFVAYSYKSGPFRGSYVKLGLDPRDNPEYAIYQVEHFRVFSIEDEKALKSGNVPSSLANASLNDDNPHEFDGERLPTSRMLQFCDVTDRFLADRIRNSARRKTCDSVDGWYEHNYFEELKCYLREKLRSVRAGLPLSNDDLIAKVESEMKRTMGDDGLVHRTKSAGITIEDDGYDETKDEEYNPDEDEDEDEDMPDDDDDAGAGDDTMPFSEREHQVLKQLEAQGLAGIMQQDGATTGSFDILDNDDDSSDND